MMEKYYFASKNVFAFYFHLVCTNLFLISSFDIEFSLFGKIPDNEKQKMIENSKHGLQTTILYEYFGVYSGIEKPKPVFAQFIKV
jgi:hypothetical protein